MNFKDNEFNFDLSVTKQSPLSFGIISPKNLIFGSLEPFRILKTVDSNKESFLNGNFRKKDGKLFVASTRKGNLSMFHLSSMKILRVFNNSTNNIYSTSFSDNGLNLISSGDSGTITLWDIGEQKSLRKIQAGKDVIKSISYLPDHDDIIGCSSYDGKIRIYDLRCRKKIFNCTFGYPVESFRFFPNQRIIVGIGGNSIKFWDLRFNSTIFNLSEGNSILSISNPNQKSIIYSTSGKHVKYIRTSDFKFFPFGHYKKNISLIESFDYGVLLGFASGEVLLKSKKDQEIKFIGEKFPYMKLKLKSENTNWFHGNNFLSALKIFGSANLKISKSISFNKFKDSYFNKIQFKKFNSNKLLSIRNGNYWKLDFYFFLNEIFRVNTYYFSKNFNRRIFFDFESRKSLYKAILIDYFGSKIEEKMFPKFEFSFLQILFPIIIKNGSNFRSTKRSCSSVFDKLLSMTSLWLKKNCFQYILLF